MAFEDRPTRRQRIRFDDGNDDNILVLGFTVRGEKQTATSALITIFKPGVATAVQTSTAMTVNTSLLEYTINTAASTSTWEVLSGYRADIVVTFNSITYPRTVMFDIVTYVMRLGLTIDQLVELDENVSGMSHAGDEDFSQVINACADIVQAHLERKSVKEKKLLQDMILDYAALEGILRFRVLAQIYQNHKDPDSRDYYNDLYDTSLRSFLSTVRFDDDMDGEEGTELGGVQEIRLVM